MSNRNDQNESPELDWGYEGKARVNRERREKVVTNIHKAAPVKRAVASDQSAKSKHVMVIDDDTDVADVLTAILECNGYIVKTMNNASDALKELIARDYDAIICDIVMPKMPGDMFYLAVSKVKPHLCDRFLFITGHGGDVQVAAFLFRVQRPIVYKPVVMEELVEAVFQMLPANVQAEQIGSKADISKPRLASSTGRPRRS